MNSYIDRIKTSIDNIKHQLQAKGFSIDHFDAVPEPGRVYVPTDARSEFLTNRALGDWAEKSLAGAIRETFPGWGIAHYGQSDSISAGDTGFKEFYLSQQALVRAYGKRPDLLLFENKDILDEYTDYDISLQPIEVLDQLARVAFSSIEVRSSKVEAHTYMNARQAEAVGRRASSTTRMAPSFTLKVEDLPIVCRWITRYQKRQMYCQVFFDSVWAMDFADMLTWVTKNTLKIENPDKSQGKATILIPITAGKEIGRFQNAPDYGICRKVSRLGRHDHYLEPIVTPGNLVLDSVVFSEMLAEKP